MKRPSKRGARRTRATTGQASRLRRARARGILEEHMRIHAALAKQAETYQLPPPCPLNVKRRFSVRRTLALLAVSLFFLGAGVWLGREYLAEPCDLCDPCMEEPMYQGGESLLQDC